MQPFKNDDYMLIHKQNMIYDKTSYRKICIFYVIPPQVLQRKSFVHQSFNDEDGILKS